MQVQHGVAGFGRVGASILEVRPHCLPASVAGVVPRFVEFLQRADAPQLQVRVRVAQRCNGI